MQDTHSWDPFPEDILKRFDFYVFQIIGFTQYSGLSFNFIYHDIALVYVDRLLLFIG